MNDVHIHIIEHGNFDMMAFTWQDLVRTLMKDGVQRAGIIPFLTQHLNSEVVNFDFFGLVRRLGDFIDRDRVFPFYWPHPQEVSERFIMAHKSDIAGIKYHPSISQLPIDKAEPVLDAAERLKVPLLVHCGRSKISDIDYVIEAAKYYPDVRFIAAHMGGMAGDRIVRALKLLEKARLRNVYLETSGCRLPNLIRMACDALGSERVLFGSDTPFSTIRVQRAVIDEAFEGLSKLYSDMVLKDNFEKLFGVEKCQ